MKNETAKLIREATKALRLRDIVLFESRLFREDSLPDVEKFEGIQQHRRGVRYAVGDRGEAEDAVRELHVIISLGERVVEQAEEDARVYFGIEADYLVIYETTVEVSDDAMKAFSNYNSVHNVWPFWRQHVFDMVAQARLPHLDVPLFAGTGP